MPRGITVDEIVLQNLWGHEEHSPLPPVLEALLSREGDARHDDSVMLGESDDLVAGLYLLMDLAEMRRTIEEEGRERREYQRLGGREEHDLAAGKPAVEVEHDDGRDEGLAQASRENDQGVLRIRKIEESVGGGLPRTRRCGRACAGTRACRSWWGRSRS